MDGLEADRLVLVAFSLFEEEFVGREIGVTEVELDLVAHLFGIVALGQVLELGSDVLASALPLVRAIFIGVLRRVGQFFSLAVGLALSLLFSLVLDLVLSILVIYQGQVSECTSSLQARICTSFSLILGHLHVVRGGWRSADLCGRISAWGVIESLIIADRGCGWIRLDLGFGLEI